MNDEDNMIIKISRCNYSHEYRCCLCSKLRAILSSSCNYDFDYDVSKILFLIENTRANIFGHKLHG